MKCLQCFTTALAIGLFGASPAIAAPPIKEPVDTTVINDQTNPVPVDIINDSPSVVEAGKYTVIRGAATIPDSGAVQKFVGSGVLFTVPSDKVLIIEDSSAIYHMGLGTYPNDASFSLSLSLRFSGSTRTVGIGTTALPGPGGNPINGRSVGRTTKVYAFPDTEVRCIWDRNFEGLSDLVRCELHGRLVEADAVGEIHE